MGIRRFRFSLPGHPFAAGRDLTAFLHSPRVTDRTDDDLSLCLARWTAPAGQ